MNRRDFTRSLASLALAPVLPMLPNTAAAAPAFTPYMYGLGAHMARTSGTCSPAMLARKLCISPASARAMQAQLIRGGVLSAPSATGIAAAAQPYMTSTQLAGVVGSNSAQRVRKLVDHLTEPEATDITADEIPKDKPDL